jgi:hypothetical protein
MRSIAFFLVSCAVPNEARVQEPVTPPPEVTRDLVPAAPPVVSAVGSGELPWWHDLTPGVYRLGAATVVLAPGASGDHHHIAEGFSKSKVSARVAVRRAAERLTIEGLVPEPFLFDLFITRDQRFLALYRIDVPLEARVAGETVELSVPAVGGQHRLGRHVFDGERHLFLECEVEGPIANPDWGRSRASAMASVPPPRGS